MARQWSARCYGVARQREGSRQNSIGVLSSPLAREGADGQAVVCPLLRGSSATRGVAPKQHRGSGVLSLRHFSGWFSLSLGAWVPKNLARRRMVSAGAMLLDRLGPPGFRFNDFRSPALTPFLTLSARGR